MPCPKGNETTLVKAASEFGSESRSSKHSHVRTVQLNSSTQLQSSAPQVAAGQFCVRLLLPNESPK